MCQHLAGHCVVQVAGIGGSLARSRRDEDGDGDDYSAISTCSDLLSRKEDCFIKTYNFLLQKNYNLRFDKEKQQTKETGK